VNAAAVWGITALGLAIIALGLALIRRGAGRRTASVLVPIAIVLGTLHWVVRMAPLTEHLLTVASILLSIAALWSLYRGWNSQLGGG
jgi:hypothetical protein